MRTALRVSPDDQVQERPRITGCFQASYHHPRLYRSGQTHMTSVKELSSGLTRGLAAHKPAGKFMVEYHEQLGDKIKIREVAVVEAKDLVEAARES